MTHPTMTRGELAKAALWMRYVGAERLEGALRMIEKGGPTMWPFAQPYVAAANHLLAAADILEGCAENTDNHPTT